MEKRGKIIRVACAGSQWRWVIDTDDGERHYLLGVFFCGPRSPQEGEVGDCGTMTYRSGASFGFWFWTPDVKTAAS
jgi:hypothetical protein